MPRLMFLQMLRAVAASLVVLDHAMIALIDHGEIARSSFLHPAWMLGWLGVAVFFTTSGLIMQRQSVDHFGSLENALRFIYRRVVRVVPLYWIATLLIVALKVAEDRAYDTKEIFASLFFIPFPSREDGLMRPVLGLGWTLNYEMFFYAIFSIALIFARRIGVVLCLSVFGFLFFLGALTRSGLTIVAARTAFAFYTDPMILLFAAGIVLALLDLRKVSATPARIAIPLAFLLLAIAFGFVLVFDVGFPPHLGYQTIFAICSVGAVWLCASAQPSAIGPTGRMLASAGDASYSTYLFHNYTLGITMYAWRHLPEGLHRPWLYILAVLIFSNLVGLMVHMTIERPLTRVLKGLTFEPLRAFLPLPATQTK